MTLPGLFEVHEMNKNHENLIRSASKTGTKKI